MPAATDEIRVEVQCSDAATLISLRKRYAANIRPPIVEGAIPPLDLALAVGMHFTMAQAEDFFRGLDGFLSGIVSIDIFGSATSLDHIEKKSITRLRLGNVVEYYRENQSVRLRKRNRKGGAKVN